MSSNSTAADALFQQAIKKYEFYVDQYNEPIAVERLTTCAYRVFTDKELFIRRLRNDYYTQNARTINNNMLNTAYENIVASYGSLNDNRIETAERIYYSDDTLYYDLQQPDRKIIKICSEKIRRVSQKTLDFCFLPSASSLPQIKPDFDVKTSEYMSLIRQLFNVSEQDSILLGAYIISLFFPNISHPILVIGGQYGSAKSTAMRLITKIVNPQSKDLMTLPKDLNNLATVLANNYLCPFDNVSYINNDIANLLCISVTGGSYSKRKLYTDSCEAVLNLKSCVMINRIGLSITQSDFLDRCICVNFERISDDNRLTDTEVNERFERVLPKLLGCIFKIIRRVIDRQNKVHLECNFRMADFARISYIACEVMKKGSGNKFIEQYAKNINEAVSTSVADNPLLDSVQHLMADKEIWRGQMTDLLFALEAVYYSISISRTLPYSFPKSANALSRKLKLYERDLKLVEIEVTIGRATDRYVELKNKKIIVDTDEER